MSDIEALHAALSKLELPKVPPELGARIETAFQEAARIVTRGVLPRQVELDLSQPVEMIEIRGWRFQFIPSIGSFAGQPITRVFVTITGNRSGAERACRNRYGLAAHILAGAALHSDERFGEFDE